MSYLEPLGDIRVISAEVISDPLADRLQGLEAISLLGGMDARTFKYTMIHPNKDIGLAFLQGDCSGRIRTPHFIGCFGDNGPVVRFGTMWMADPLRQPASRVRASAAAPALWRCVCP